MENAVDALKMAAAILIFIIAIGVSFSLFGTAKQTADSIILMRDKQAYLESAELDNGILYTSTEAIEKGSIEGFTENGDRVVKKDTVISTIYRYNKEKYGVTIINGSGTVIARFDSNTENVMRQWNNITSGKEAYADKIKENISTKYLSSVDISLDLEELYKIKVDGNENIKCGAPWYGNDEQIRTRISCELKGSNYKYNGQTYIIENSLDEILTNANQIIEVTNEIDESKYLEDETIEGNDKSTNLLQQYEMPTVEIVYILSE